MALRGLITLSTMVPQCSAEGIAVCVCACVSECVCLCVCVCERERLEHFTRILELYSLVKPV